MRGACQVLRSKELQALPPAALGLPQRHFGLAKNASSYGKNELLLYNVRLRKSRRRTTRSDRRIAPFTHTRYDRPMRDDWESLKGTKHFEDLLEFPCGFSIKIICRAGGWVREAVEQQLATVPPDPGAEIVTERLSRGGKYVALTVRLRVVSGGHLRRCYTVLKDLDSVRLVL